MNEWLNGWIRMLTDKGWVLKWMYATVRMNEWMNEWINEWVGSGRGRMVDPNTRL